MKNKQTLQGQRQRTMPRRLLFPLSLLLVTFSITGPLFAQDAEEIMSRADEITYAETSRMRMRMIIYPELGNESNIREFFIESYSRGEEDSYMEFLEPRSIKGLKILTLDDDIRVYFPSTGRIRRITGSKKSGSAGGIGGDFSYEDMGGGGYLETYKDFRLLSEDGNRWKVEAVPADKDSSYNRVVFFISKQTNLPEKTDFYTPEGGHYKTLTAEGWRTVSGRPLATILTMTNHDEEQKTVINITAAAFNITVAEKLFNPSRFYR